MEEPLLKDTFYWRIRVFKFWIGFLLPKAKSFEPIQNMRDKNKKPVVNSSKLAKNKGCI